MFLLTVVEGREKGLTWLVDPLLSSTVIQKFSGTSQAGSNTDLAGMTCDAFAHFSLYDSEGDLVFVDIQGVSLNFVLSFISKSFPGIIVPRIVQGLRGSDLLTLLDLMAHRCVLHSCHRLTLKRCAVQHKDWVLVTMDQTELRNFAININATTSAASSGSRKSNQQAHRHAIAVSFH